MSSQRLRSDVLLFWQIDADLDDLYAVSCNYVAKLCQGLFNEPQQLNAIRWQHALSFTKYVTIDRLVSSAYIKSSPTGEHLAKPEDITGLPRIWMQA